MKRKPRRDKKLKVKQCSVCKEIKPISAFSRRGNKGWERHALKSNCNDCRYKTIKRCYDKDKERVRERSRQRRQELRELLQQAKTKPCADCGITYPYYVMDFDHRPDETKHFKLASASRWHSREKLLTEVKKCDVVCANCHRIRTFERKQHLK